MFLTFAMLVCATGCSNALRDFPKRDSDDYLIAETRKCLDNLDFDNAIVNITPVLAKRPQDADIAYLASAAYAGRSGLRILDLFASLGSDLSTKSILTVFAEHYAGAVDLNVSDMERAISILETYGPRAADRSADLNFFALFLYYSRIGVILNRYAFNASNSLRANFAACHTDENLSGPTTGLPNEMVDRIMVTIPRIIETIPAIASGAGLSAAALDTSVLSALGLSFDPIPCTTDPNNVACIGTRILIAQGKNTNGVGLGTSDPLLPPCNGSVSP